GVRGGQGAELEALLDLAGVIHAGVLDLRAEQSRQGEGLQAIYAEVLRLGERLDRLHERALRPADSLCVREEGERRLLRALVQRYHALPEEQRDHLPALLDAVGRLELASGDFEAAQGDFRRLAVQVSEPQAQAAAHHGTYLAALERRDWAGALAALRNPLGLDAARYAPFPLDHYEPERILGAGGFGVVFLCRNRFSRGQVVVKALRTDEMERAVTDVFEEASVLEGLEHPAIIRVRDCAFAGG